METVEFKEALNEFKEAIGQFTQELEQFINEGKQELLAEVFSRFCHSVGHLGSELAAHSARICGDPVNWYERIKQSSEEPIFQDGAKEILLRFIHNNIDQRMCIDGARLMGKAATLVSRRGFRVNVFRVKELLADHVTLSHNCCDNVIEILPPVEKVDKSP